MKNSQAIGQYERLRAELAEAYAEAEWSSSRIDRIADELAALERTLAAAAPLEEQDAVAAWISTARRDLGSHDDLGINYGAGVSKAAGASPAAKRHDLTS